VIAMRHRARTAEYTLGLCLIAAAVPAWAGDALSSAAYREAAAEWHATWQERPSLFSRTEDNCVAAWQIGDRVRTRIVAATPPEAFAPYHEALRAYVDAALAAADECLLQPRGGPRWREMVDDAAEKGRAITMMVRRERLKLPTNW
jgi:hypothetical protein